MRFICLSSIIRSFVTEIAENVVASVHLGTTTVITVIDSAAVKQMSLSLSLSSVVLKVERDGRVFYIKTDLPLTSRRMRLPTFLVSGSGVNYDGARVSTHINVDFSL